MKAAVIVLLCTILVANAKSIKNLKSFQWNNCGAADSPVRMENWSITPDPITIPGTVTIAETLVADVPIVSPTKGSLTARYQPLSGGDWIDIPCQDGIGSCEYDDVCATLDEYYPPTEPCPAVLAIHGYPCHCPIDAGTYALKDAKIFFTQPLSINEGNYYAKTRLYTDVGELACYELYLTIVSA